jgi:NADH-quinone oxidoreductase subunit M
VQKHLISIMIALPLLGAAFQTLRLRGGRNVMGIGALLASLASSVLALVLVFNVPAFTSDASQIESLPWVGSFAISYVVGLDGLGVPFLLLVAAVFPVLIGYEWNQKYGSRGMNALFLMLQSAFLGVICAQDLFLQFFFWALTILPFYFLMGVWGGAEREKSSFRGVVVASIANGLIFAALVLIYYAADPHTFDLQALEGGKLGEATFRFLGQNVKVSVAAFTLMAIGLSLRAAVWPLHGWLVKAVEGSTPTVTVALTAVSIPISMYLFIRWGYALLPETMREAAPGIVLVGAINLIFGMICAAAQKTLKGLFAYFCMALTGFALIGVGSLDAMGIVGAVYQQFVAGVAFAGLGLFIGVFEDRSSGDRFLEDDGTPTVSALSYVAPAMAVTVGFFLASLLNFPGLGGFVSSSLLVIGSYSVHPGWVVAVALALVLGAYGLFSMYRVVFLSVQSKKPDAVADLNWRERACLIPLVAILLFTGIYPKPLMDVIRPTALTLLSMVK